MSPELWSLLVLFVWDRDKTDLEYYSITEHTIRKVVTTGYKEHIHLCGFNR